MIVAGDAASQGGVHLRMHCSFYLIIERSQLMNKSRFLVFLLMCLYLLGALASAWATTRNVPAPNGTDDTSNIQSTINGAASGDTILFSSGGQYKVSSRITLASNLTYTGNGCTLNWIANSTATASNTFYLNGLTNLTISGFTFNGNAYGGNIEIDGFNPSTYLTITNNTFENNSFNGSNGFYGATAGIYDYWMTNSSITYNTFANIANGQGIMIYGAGNDTFSNNTFSNLATNDCLQIGGLNGTTGSGIVFQYNVGTNNCNSCGIEIGDGGDTSYPTTTNMLIDGNSFTIGPSPAGEDMALSIVNAGTGTTISNNTLAASNTPQEYSNVMEFITDAPAGNVQPNPLNATVTKNIFQNDYYAILNDGEYNTNTLFDYNLFVNIANENSSGNYVWDPGTSVNCNGAADQFKNNWAYQCLIDTTNYPTNANLSGSCPTMSMTATTATCTDNPVTNGVFTITSSLAPSQNTSVSYTVSGTATGGTDYQTLSGTATIAAGTTSTTINVTPLYTGKTGSYTVIATLAFGPYYINSASKTATVTITASAGSLPTVIVAASPTSINEKSGTSTYTVTRTGSTTSALTVNYAMSGTATNGTDYNTLSGSMIIASGSSTGTVPLTTIDRGLTSGSKTAILTISSNANYTVGTPSNATVTILDNDTGSGGSLSGSTVTASTSTYNLTSLGTTDWSHWNNTGWIHKSAGGSQISNVTQFGGGSYGNFSTSSRNVSWTDGTPTPSNADDQFAYFCQNKANSGWTFTVPADTTSRTLYVMWGGYTGASVKLNAHLSDSSAADYTNALTLIGSGTDTYLETITYTAASASQTLTLTLTNVSGTSASLDIDAAWLITNSALPTVSVAASPTSINEANGTSTYTVTRTGSTASALTVNYAMSGTAVSGTDYTALSGSLTIASGSSTGTVTLSTIDRGLTSGSKTAILSLSTNANYTVGAPSNATVTINDNDIPTVTVAASPTSINEKNGTSTYTVTRTDSTTSALTVNYAMSGTAVSGTDYTALSGSLTIASGQTTGTAILTTIDRGLTSGSKTAILTITTNAGYTVGSPSSATVSINDNDASGGALSGNSVTASTSTYNLTSLGTADWSHWNNNGWIHKSAGGSQISNVTQFGSGTFSNFATSSRNVSWTDGTPTTSNTDDQYAIYCNNAANSGWTFTVPAGTTSQTLYIMWGGYTGASVKLNAHLSDGSSADYNDAMTLTGSGSDTYIETITYHAASAGQTLKITLSNVSGGSASVDLDAAWLVTSGGSLVGSTATASTSTYNLTSLGTTDWSHGIRTDGSISPPAAARSATLRKSAAAPMAHLTPPRAT
jgi:hypothetical protein